MKKVLIAGGNGVIGRLLAEGLLSDYEVTVLDKDHFDGTASSIQADAA
ncbi:NAD(P)-dependent oxidoreductase, partial [Bacillus spizizenii]|nr:NAD(P)-dependent oxidoreductase [Bacillus spizizenii]